MIRKFTSYDNHYFIFCNLKRRSKEKIALAIFEYMFEDFEPNFDFKNEREEYCAWSNLKQLLSKNKKQIINAENKGIEQFRFEPELELKSELKLEVKSRDNSESESISILDISNYNISKLDNKVLNSIIDYLNYRTKKKYRYTENNRKYIKSRLNEGFTLEDIKKVIDIKSNEWLNDEKMNKYLRPETLFGNKFENYLNQQKGKITTNDIAKTIDWEEFLNE